MGDEVTSVAIAAGAGVLWVLVLLVLTSITVSADTAGVRVGAGVLLVAAFIVPIVAVAALGIRADRQYREHCRAIGGIPVETEESINCQGKNGRFIDIER